ncbi:hypothetical protein WK62_05320 [Burkholderia ubonensis]|uniref:hypothetical protein n=1 Tax=Burkholderia ubonensis TaxID=101571 RepID=UPI00075E95E4|nr:hypothetical protein [Burkholderia ubonensis]KVU10685.1 hypothetical protein WK62_05320 [Burkholderia ubonensis]
MDDLAKVAIFVAVLWAMDKWNAISKATDDFKNCHAQALEVLVTEKQPPGILLLSPNLSQHDQIDELIQRCMMALDYDYVSDGWKNCPIEKLPACYEQPSFATRVYRSIRALISSAH